MTSSVSIVMSAVLALASFAAPVAALAQTTAPMTAPSGTGALTAQTPNASGAKTGQRKSRARVTGGPGYVSQGGATAASAPGNAAAAKGVRARVTGGPGGTAGSISGK